MRPAGEDVVADVDGLVRRLEFGRQATAQLKKLEEGDAAGRRVGRQAARCRAGHPCREDVVVCQKSILRVPVGLDRVRGRHRQVRHRAVAEFSERRGGKVDHVLLGGAQPDRVPDHGRDEAEPAEAAEDLGPKGPGLFILVYLAAADTFEGIFMDTRERNDVVFAAREDAYPVVDDGLQPEKIAHGVGEGY